MGPENISGDSDSPDLDPMTGLPRPSQTPNQEPPTEAPHEPEPAAEPVTGDESVAEPSPGPEEEEELERELKKWNWGGFFLTWIWGIGNGTLVSLLALIPMVNFVMMIVLGWKGNALAWQNKDWRDLDHFRRTQRAWAKWSCILMVLFLVTFAAMFGSILLGVTGIMKNSEAFRHSLQVVSRDSTVQEALGTPIKAGFFVSGNIELNGGQGSAMLSYPVKGPKDSGQVYVEAFKRGGDWSYEWIGVEIGRDKRKVNLTPGYITVPETLTTSPDAPQVNAAVPGQTISGGSAVTLHLVNGNKLRGVLVRETASSVSVETEDLGTIVFSRNEIASIE